MEVVSALFITLLGTALYMLPTLIAFIREHNNKGSIVIINIFLGWTLLGWVIPLAMAFSGNVKK